MKDRYFAYSRKDQPCLKCIHDFVLDINCCLSFTLEQAGGMYST